MKPCGCVPVEHPRRVQAGLAPSAPRPARRARCPPCRAARPSRCGWPPGRRDRCAGSAGSWRRPRPSRRVSGRSPWAGATRCEPARRRRLRASRVGPGDRSAGRGDGADSARRSWIIDSTNPPAAGRRPASCLQPCGPDAPTARRMLVLPAPMPDPTRAAWRRWRAAAAAGAAGAGCAAGAGRAAPSRLARRTARAAAARRSWPRPSRPALRSQLPSFVDRRPHPGPARPGDRGRRQCRAAPRRHRDPRRPARVLPARRPGQGHAATCASTRPATSTRARSWSSRSSASRASSTNVRYRLPAQRRPTARRERIDFIDAKRADRPQRHLHHLPARGLARAGCRAWILRAAQHHAPTPRKNVGAGRRRAAELHGRDHACRCRR